MARGSGSSAMPHAAITGTGAAMAGRSRSHAALCFVVMTGMALCCLECPVEKVALLALGCALAVKVARGRVTHVQHHGKLDLGRGPSRPYHAPKIARHPSGLSRL